MTQFINIPLRKGVSIIEAVVYVAILTVLMLVLVTSLLSMTGGYSHIKINADMERTASALFNRLSYEVRSSEQINMSTSVLGTPASILVVERGSGSTSESVTFSLVSNVIRIAENGVDRGPLATSNGVSVDSFTVIPLPSGASEAVTVQAQLTSRKANRSITRMYQGTIILKSSY